MGFVPVNSVKQGRNVVEEVESLRFSHPDDQ